MSHIEREYLFEGCQIPKKFMDAVYSRSREARNIIFEGTFPENYGDDILVRVSAPCDEVLDWFLEEWAHLEVKR